MASEPQPTPFPLPPSTARGKLHSRWVQPRTGFLVPPPALSQGFIFLGEGGFSISHPIPSYLLQRLSSRRVRLRSGNSFLPPSPHSWDRDSALGTVHCEYWDLNFPPPGRITMPEVARQKYPRLLITPSPCQAPSYLSYLPKKKSILLSLFPATELWLSEFDQEEAIHWKRYLKLFLKDLKVLR